jgi:hypothetical protein
MQPTTIGLAVDKLSGMPKKVRRLLAQMLSANPAGRPQDPLALYRQIQGCIAQFDRRESMARRFAVPFLSRSSVVDLPSRKRFPAKTIALAAILVAIATVTAVMLSHYFRHQRIRQAEEPIGVPIGVSDATAPASPATTNAPTVASAPVPPEPATPATVPLENQPPPAPVESTPAVAANKQPSVAPVQPEVTAQPADTQPAEPPKVAANQSNVVPETATASQPAESVRPEVREPEPSRDTEVAAAIPTARPVSPEVRRAEPPPSADGPEEITPARTEKKIVTNSKPKKEHAKKPKREPEEQIIMRAEPAADEEEGPDTSLPQLPRGRTRARFIGVTADGNWMFALPSKKIVIVPPPPGG